MTNQSPTTDPKDGMLPVGELRQLQLDAVLIKLQNAGIEVGLKGAPETLDPSYSLKDARRDIEALFTAATNEKLAGGGDAAKPVSYGIDIYSWFDRVWFEAYHAGGVDAKKFIMSRHLLDIAKPEFEQLVNTAKQTAVAEARYQELKTMIAMVWDPNGSYYPRDDVPHELLAHLTELEKEMRNVLEGKS